MSLRVDGHQHFWSLERDDYGWLTPDLAPLYRDFGPAHLAPLLAEAGVHKTILVQAAASVDETRYLLSIAERHDFVAGVVGWIDMESGAAAPGLLSSLAQHPKFVGIRPVIQAIEDPAWINKTELKVAVESLVEHSLCFDALVKSVHLPYLLKFLGSHPDLKAVVDHGARPDIASAEWQPWADGVSAIAERTSALCKLSGLITEAGALQTYEDLVPYMDHLLESFGPERLIWGSDWPVLNLGGDYQGWHRASSAWLSALTDQERTSIQGGNAAKFYGLNSENDDLT